MTDPNWPHLIAAALQGDQHAWQTMVEQLRPLLRQTAAGQLPQRVRRRVDPSDVVQQSLLEAWKARAGFGGSSQAELLKWLCRIVERNLQDVLRQHIQADKRSVDHERSLDELRSSGAFRPEVFVASELSPRSELAHREVLSRLVDSVATLSPQQRDAVRMRYFERCSLADMAARLDLTENAAAQLLHRGLQSIRRLYREGEAPEP
ncbi:MAG: sigma-70 family RNA polymerase sigma factor [Pirellulales bacterium]